VKLGQNGIVSLPIRLAVFQASLIGAYMKNLNQLKKLTQDDNALQFSFRR